jgi:hypothetical protein
VSLDGGILRIHNLEVFGVAAEVVRQAIEQGREPEATVRRMLEVGGMVLAHGTQTGLVDAVVHELRREGATEAAVRAIAERSAAKGLKYEEEIQPVLEAAYAPHFDLVEATGTTAGLDGRDKKGDFVITLDPASVSGRDLRVVVEAKDKPSQRLAGKDGALTYLAGAMRNRGAEAGVFVCATPVPALAGHRLRTYPGNRVLVLFEKDGGDPLALEVACQLARAFAARTSNGETGLSARVLTDRIERLREVIEQAAEIRGGILEAKRGMSRVSDAYDTLRKEALAVIGDLQDRLGK